MRSFFWIFWPPVELLPAGGCKLYDYCSVYHKSFMIINVMKSILLISFLYWNFHIHGRSIFKWPAWIQNQDKIVRTLSNFHSSLIFYPNPTFYIFHEISKFLADLPTNCQLRCKIKMKSQNTRILYKFYVILIFVF